MIDSQWGEFGMRIFRVLCGLVLVVTLLTAGVAVAQQGTEPTPTASPTPVHDQCIAVEEPTLDWISKGLYQEDQTTLSSVWAVHSEDFENVWFVAADLDGPGLEADDEIALWATNAISEDGSEHSTGIVLSVNGIAGEFSDWPNAEDYDDGPTDENDGADEAVDCAKGNEDD